MAAVVTAPAMTHTFYDRDLSAMLGAVEWSALLLAWAEAVIGSFSVLSVFSLNHFMSLVLAFLCLSVSFCSVSLASLSVSIPFSHYIPPSLPLSFFTPLSVSPFLCL